MTLQEKYLTLAFLKEKVRRLQLRKKILFAIDLNFTREHGPIVKRGVVYEAVARTLSLANNNHFKRTVKNALNELGIVAICTHKTYLFKNLGNADSAALIAFMRKNHSDRRARQKLREGIQ